MLRFRLALGCAIVVAAAVVRADQSAHARVSPPFAVESAAVVRARMALNRLHHTYSDRPQRSEQEEEYDWVPGWVNDEDLIQRSDRLAQGNGGWTGPSGATMWPSDANLAVGPNQVVVATNAGFAAYDKSGAQTFASTFASFFASVLPKGAFCVDPRVIYDRSSGRWFLICLAIRNSDTYSWYMLATSAGDDPAGTWAKWAIDSTVNGGASSPYWSDYPAITATGDALVVTANMFLRTWPNFGYVKVRVFAKQQLLQASQTLDYNDIWDIKDGDGNQAFSIQPAETYGSSTAFLADTESPDALNVFELIDPLGSPYLISEWVQVATFGAPPSAPQKGGTPDLADWPYFATVAQAGVIATPRVGHFYPTVAVNAEATLLLSFSRSGPWEYASMEYAYRRAGDPASVCTTPAVVHVGSLHYTGENPAATDDGTVMPVRWGDYSGVAVDHPTMRRSGL